MYFLSNYFLIGTIQYQGRNDNSQDVIYGEIQSSMLDVSDGAEDGSLSFQTRKAGTQTTYMTLSGASGRVNILQELFLTTGNKIKFEGATSNANETTLTVADPSQDNTITLPDVTGEVIVNSGGQTMTSHLQFADNAQLRIGDSNDLVIRHDGGHSLIEDNGQGDLYIRASDNLNIQADDGAGGWQNAIQTQFTGSDAKVAFFNGGTQVFSTLPDGLSIDVSGGIRFEGATADGNETSLTVTDPTADRTITLPDASGTVALTSDISVTASSTTTLTNKTLTNPTINGATLSGTFGGTANLTGLVLAGASPLKFEGSNDDANETSLAVQNPTADRTITLPNITGRIDELLITEGSFNSTSLAFNSSVITNEYSEFRLVLSNCKPSTQTYVYMRVGSSNSADTGSNYGQAYYLSGYYGTTNAYSINYVGDNIQALILADGYAQLGTGTGQNGHFEITLLNPNTSSHYKLFKINSQIYSYYPMLMGRYIDAAVWRSTAAINYIQVYPGSGNLALEYKLYGVKS